MFACVYLLQDADDALLLACAGTFSPSVELIEARTAVFDVRGLSRQYPEGNSQIGHAIRDALSGAGLTGNVALGPNLELTVAAAQNRPGLTLLSAEGKQLANLPLAHLRLTPEMEEVLRLWGIGSAGEFAALPLDDLMARCGERAETLHRLLHGSLNRPLTPVGENRAYSRSFEFEHPVKESDQCLFVLAGMLRELLADLQADGLAAGALAVRFQAEGRWQGEAPGPAETILRPVTFPLPTTNQKLLLRLLQHDLESFTAPGLILAVALDIAPSRSRVLQLRLFEPAGPEPDKLEMILSRIARLVGSENVGIPVLLDTHHARSFALDPRGRPAARRDTDPLPPLADQCALAFRLFHPPIKVSVQLHQGRPRRLRSGQRSWEVERASGPWITAGQWWETLPWRRQEWDIASTSGELFRLCLNREEVWELEGAYD